jgi:hypothetical protein
MAGWELYLYIFNFSIMDSFLANYFLFQIFLCTYANFIKKVEVIINDFVKHLNLQLELIE